MVTGHDDDLAVGPESVREAVQRLPGSGQRIAFGAVAELEQVAEQDEAIAARYSAASRDDSAAASRTTSRLLWEPMCRSETTSVRSVALRGAEVRRRRPRPWPGGSPWGA